MNLAQVLFLITMIIFLLGFLYFLRTSTMTKKFLAIDFMSLIGGSVMALYAVVMNSSLYLDIIMVWALVNFLGTIAFAVYLNGLNNRKKQKSGV